MNLLVNPNLTSRRTSRMAILEAALPGLTVSIVVNGQTLAEYNDDHQEIFAIRMKKVVSKYVEVHEGAEFGIQITADQGFKTLNPQLDCPLISYNFYVDGVKVRCMTTDLCDGEKE